MNVRSVVLVLLLAVAVGLMGAWGVHVFRTAAWSNEMLRAARLYDAFHHDLQRGDAGDDPRLVLLHGTARLDAASRARFDKHLAHHPLPTPVLIDPERYPRPTDRVGVYDKFGRTAFMVRENGTWRPDLEGVAVDVPAARAGVLRDELLRLADRVEAGHFATHDDLQAAVSGTVFLGLLRGLGTDASD